MSSIRISKTMGEVHKWREEIYNETKGMPLKKKLNYFHRVFEEADVKKKLRGKRVIGVRPQF